MNFVKYHAAGNAFILIDEWNIEKVENKSNFSKNYCDRYKGIGADGVIFLQKSSNADLKFRLLQPNGSEAGMSGNGMRCFVKFALDENRIDKTEFKVETDSGVHQISVDNNQISVNMGKTKFEPEKIPSDHKLIDDNLEGYKVTACNTGVPHVVIFSEDVSSIDLEKEAPKIRNSNIFPKGVNVNFAEEKDDGFHVRTFERGVEAETLSCGTGNVAVASAARKLDKIDKEAILSSEGGEMKVYFENEEAFLEGSAEKVFEGKIN